MSQRTCGLIVAVLTAVACSGSNATSPPPRPHAIQLLAGDGQTDTIQTVLHQALVIGVGTGPDGSSGAHQVVRFEAVLDSGTYQAFIEPLAGGTPSAFVAETTNTSGEAAVVVVLGSDVGVGKIAVNVPAFGYVDTAHFTVQPGHAVGMQAAPNDTAAYIGGAVGLRTAVVDRYGNPRSDVVSFNVLTGPGALQGRTLSVNGYGPIQIVGSADGYADTTAVFGVPSGTMAASSDVTGIYTFNLDGSNLTPISQSFAGTLKWAPNGQSLAFDQTVNGLYGATDVLQTVQLNGQVATIVNSGPTALAYPQYSRDGQWIYYNQYSSTQPIWRVHPDGSGDTAVYMAAPEALQFPSPSPDGTKLSYILGGGYGNLKVLTLSNGTAVDLGVQGAADVWSPAGNVIAYLTLGSSIATINSDGSGGTVIATGPYGTQFDWSPDGKWIIARNTATSRLELIQVATQLIIPLGYTGTLGSPTWH